jgi:pyruvate/oxaloacetate carboxyltransferase
VREDLGYISLVTPTSQLIVVQATLNVIAGKRYKTITNETRELLRGGYGRTPGPLNLELQKKSFAERGANSLQTGRHHPERDGSFAKWIKMDSRIR